jgi:hypothetical protein
MSVEYKFSVSDRISNIATFGHLITGTGCWNVTEEMEQCLAHNPSTGNNETEEINSLRFRGCQTRNVTGSILILKATSSECGFWLFS